MCVPHDEAPMRVLVVGEVWAEAVQQVLQPVASQLMAEVGALKAVLAPTRAPTRGDAPAKLQLASYVELSLHVKKLIVTLQNHPLEVRSMPVCAWGRVGDTHFCAARALACAHMHVQVFLPARVKPHTQCFRSECILPSAVVLQSSVHQSARSTIHWNPG